MVRINGLGFSKEQTNAFVLGGMGRSSSRLNAWNCQMRVHVIDRHTLQPRSALVDSARSLSNIMYAKKSIENLRSYTINYITTKNRYLVSVHRLHLNHCLKD